MKLLRPFRYIAIGAAGAYFLDPESGAARRQRVMNQLAPLTRRVREMSSKGTDAASETASPEPDTASAPKAASLGEAPGLTPSVPEPVASLDRSEPEGARLDGIGGGGVGGPAAPTPPLRTGSTGR